MSKNVIGPSTLRNSDKENDGVMPKSAYLHETCMPPWPTAFQYEAVEGFGLLGLEFAGRLCAVKLILSCTVQTFGM